MRIDGRAIGAETPYFIAEAGVNHNGDLDLAEELIDAAATAGSDAVKFQTFAAARLVTRAAEKAEYQQEQGDEESQYDMLERYELDRSAHERLQMYASKRGITFLSTPFDAESADLLDAIDVPAVKVGSGELDNYPLLERIAGFGRPMIVSTGMGTMEEVHDARGVIRNVDPDVPLVFLHCTSAYPSTVDDMNLRAMETMEEELPEPIGYSDHTTLPETPAIAVAAGACVVEKHFTLDRTLPGPDHEASLEPNELARAVELVDVAARALGSASKEPVEAELENVTVVRKSLHAAVDVPAGTVLGEGDVQILRPADGLSPRYYHSVIGAETTRDLTAGEPIGEDDVSVTPDRDDV